MEWFRMYGDMPNDPKIGTLSDAEFRTWVELLCAACKAEREGGTDLDKATVDWALRRNVTETLQKLISVNLVRFSETGEIVICNWEKRQFASDSSTERVKRHRAKKAESQANQELKQPISDETLQERSSNAPEKRREDTEKKREEKKRPMATPPALPDWLPADAWDGFLAMRKSIKKPVTPDGIPIAIRKLESLRADGNDPRQVLEQSTMNSWQGLFEVRQEPRGSPAKPTSSGQRAAANEEAKRLLFGNPKESEVIDV